MNKKAFEKGYRGRMAKSAAGFAETVAGIPSRLVDGDRTELQRRFADAFKEPAQIMAESAVSGAGGGLIGSGLGALIGAGVGSTGKRMRAAMIGALIGSGAGAVAGASAKGRGILLGPRPEFLA